LLERIFDLLNRRAHPGIFRRAPGSG